MIRRSVCAALATAGPLLPSWARVREPARVYRIGVLALNTTYYDSGADVTEFVAELARRGYVNSKNVVFEKRSGPPENTPATRALVSELVQAKVDVIYALSGTISALTAKGVTASTPIVFHSSADPVGLGLVASLAKPGGNVTGLCQQSFDQAEKNLQLLLDATGNLKSVAYIVNARVRSTPFFPGYAAAVRRAASALGISVRFFDVESFEQFEPTIQRLVRSGVNGVELWNYGVTGNLGPAAALAEMLIRYRLPSIGDPRNGFLMVIGAPEGFEARTAAKYVDRILQGAKPADLPVEQPSVWELTLNLKTARGLGLVIPRSVLLRASNVIS